MCVLAPEAVRALSTKRGSRRMDGCYGAASRMLASIVVACGNVLSGDLLELNVFKVFFAFVLFYGFVARQGICKAMDLLFRDVAVDVAQATCWRCTRGTPHPCRKVPRIHPAGRGWPRLPRYRPRRNLTPAWGCACPASNIKKISGSDSSLPLPLPLSNASNRQCSPSYAQQVPAFCRVSDPCRC
ncbi:hypothetical protein N658DRAFT_271154 [Parathielavia hyrcaniae]|uniref:Uncharacterized protein n=1 Tax=Parathielavia hyrcaniae TaxID=113614 RepID=A0AAN6SYJ8_9PEZI|nr:hypothetical protein N658DRAFT_271154 [Parathielavia hyrcaniae]